jgi:hypothetical protein
MLLVFGMYQHSVTSCTFPMLCCALCAARHGPGTLMLSNGDMYEGHWENDLKHGPGTFFYMAKGCRWG